MTSTSFIHSRGIYWLLPDTQGPLLACLCLLLFALGFYLVWPGIARCYRQVRVTADWFTRATAPRPRNPTAGLPVSLYSAPDRQRSGMSRLARRIKLCIRGLIHPRQTRRWLDFWNLTSTHVTLAIATPRLLQKIYRPYQSLHLRHPERLDILTSHYDFIIRQGLAPLVLQASRQRIPIGLFNGKSGDPYEVRLAAIDSLDREGELALHLYRNDQHLFSTAFTFYRQQGLWCIGIGCLQGPGGADSREHVRRATRDMFGLRPKALMIRLVRAIGAGYGCARMVLVSNHNRVSNHRCKRDRVHADYDAFWLELGAAQRGDGDYELSCEEPTPTDINELPSRKRAEARHRLALTQQAAQEIGRVMVRLKKP
ncbi:VirK/YbjX family protein [Herbaspirillum chlorophenolicum]|uniref:VirK/YbjX family protein n=1 Tax=Herbaspirillum chlorophenolicum TaxID=211589 RepID=UPI00067ADD73|nr:VirK/YbjX family protein [Herbaspirillum chlorophenolicum]